MALPFFDTGFRGQKTEVRGQKTEVRRQKKGVRVQKTEGNLLISSHSRYSLFSDLCSLTSDLDFPSLLQRDIQYPTLW